MLSFEIKYEIGVYFVDTQRRGESVN